MKFPTLNLFYSREGEEENTNDIKEIEIRTERLKGEEEKLEKREYEKFIINLTTFGRYWSVASRKRSGR